MMWDVGKLACNVMFAQTALGELCYRKSLQLFSPGGEEVGRAEVHLLIAID
jgi:hypothetical protein